MDKRLLIIAFDEWAWRLRRYFEQDWGEGRVQTLCLDPRLFDDEPFEDVEELNQLYEQVCCFLDEQYQPESLRGLTVLAALHVELPQEEGKTQPLRDVWNPLLRYDKERKRVHSRTVLLSWLVLTYPEVRWVFLAERASPPCEDFCTTLHHWHWLSAKKDLLPQNSLPVLFDPSGLRSRIRRQVSRGKDSVEGNRGYLTLPERKLIAVSMDEEEEYAYFNAYAAYRFGYRAGVITTWHEAEMLLKSDSHKIHLSLEDLYLNFPDRPDTIKEQKEVHPSNLKQVHLSNLKQRDTLLPSLSQLQQKRVLVTVGHKRGTSRSEDNRNYERDLSYPVKTVYKPLAGIFHLWRRAGMWRRWWNRPRYAEGFQWPPKTERRAQDADGEETPRHSAPGRFVVIAERLIDRAEYIMEQFDDVPGAIHAALLALDAKELLMARTPIASLHALCIQHEAEAAAESMFTGVEYALWLRPRFGEIRREVDAIGSWFHPRIASRSCVHAQLTIVERLARRFQQMHQFEEEMQCLAEARALRFKLWRLQSGWRILLEPLLWYLRFALRSLPIFALLVIGWLILFAIGYYMSAPSDHLIKSNPWEALAGSAYTSFSLQLMPGWQDANGNVPLLWRWLLMAQSLVSFLNLGLLIAHLYLIVARR